MLELEAQNPWLRLKEKPFVLPEDAGAIAAFNAKAEGKPHKIELDVFPAPFVGSPKAPIWLLNLNPGLDASDFHEPPHVVDVLRQSIALQGESFWCLDDAYSMTSGYVWWRKMTRRLTDDYDVGKLARAFFVVEFFPYRSIKYKQPRGLLPSQSFTRELVRAGCHSGKKFVIMRKSKQWLDLVPELADAEKTELLNHNRTWISFGNVREPDMLREWLDAVE